MTLTPEMVAAIKAYAKNRAAEAPPLPHAARVRIREAFAPQVRAAVARLAAAEAGGPHD